MDRNETIECLERYVEGQGPITTVCSVVLGEQIWAYASDGHYIVALPFSPLWEFRPLELATYDKTVRDYLSPLDGGIEVELAELKAWAGPPAWPGEDICPECKGEKSKCTDCDGDGEVDCTCSNCQDEHRAECGKCEGKSHHCDGCEGTGKIHTGNEVRMGRMDRILVNRNYLARILEPFEGRARVVIPNGDEGPIKIHGDGFRLVLMPMRDAQPRDSTVPVFALKEESHAA